MKPLDRARNGSPLAFYWHSLAIPLSHLQFVTEGHVQRYKRHGPPLFSIFHLFVIKLQSTRLSPSYVEREKNNALVTAALPAKVITFLLRSRGKQFCGRSTGDRSIYTPLIHDRYRAMSISRPARLFLPSSI